MTNPDNHAPDAGYTQGDLDEVSDNPELTEEQLAQAKPLREAMPELVEAMHKRRGQQKTPTKALFSLRIDRDVLEAYRTSGPGWQRRMNDALRQAVGL